jgi:hypothetical protein
MRYDTTLHLVDEGVFARFEEELLRDASDRQPTAEDLMASALCFAAAETPHLAVYNTALSLWRNIMPGIAPIPSHLVDSLESRLPRLVERFAFLRGRLRGNLDGKCAVGCFVPACHVAEVAAHVEKALSPHSISTEVWFEPLVQMLRLAAARGLAYWEGAGLKVPTVLDPDLPTVRRNGPFRRDSAYQRFQDARLSLKIGHYYSAECSLRDILRHWPESEEAARAPFFLALGFVEDRKPHLARPILDAILEAKPAHKGALDLRERIDRALLRVAER